MLIPAGKLWSLRRLSNRRGFFTMIAVDHLSCLERIVAERRAQLPGDPRLAPTAWEDIGRIKRALIEEFSGAGSALLLDPECAYPFAVQSADPAKGLLVALEQPAWEESSGGRKTLPYPGWSAETIRRIGADGVKLSVWFRPEASPGVLAHQRTLVERVGGDCRRHDIAFILGPLIYPIGGTQAAAALTDSYLDAPGRRAELVLAAIEEFRQERYGVDMMQVETPVAAAAIADPDDGSDAARNAQALFDRIDRLLDRPWVMRSAGAATEAFRRILTYAFRSGASGYLAGRSFWEPAVQEFPDWERLRWRVRQEGLPLVQTIGEVLELYARPWIDRPALAGGIEIEGAGPDFITRYGG